MPRRLLREPHVLAHELRTPLSILAGWYSLVRDGDVTKTGTPEKWEIGMAACQTAIDRLNFIISEACNEPEALRPPEATVQRLYQTRVFEEAVDAIERSRALLARFEELRKHASGPELAAAGQERRAARRGETAGPTR